MKSRLSAITIGSKQMEIVERLEATKAATLNYYGLGDEDLARSYGPGKWTVRYILHHRHEGMGRRITTRWTGVPRSPDVSHQSRSGEG